MSSDFIFQNKQEENTITKKGDEFYTLKGLEDFIDNSYNHRIFAETSKNIFAKRVYKSNNLSKFYIKINNNGSMYNPLSIYGEEKTNDFLDRVCKSGSKFKEVNIKVFNLYIHFLNTKNIAWLHNAEREAV
jgi:hypothetical protein